MTIELGLIGCGLIARAHAAAADRAAHDIVFSCCSSKSRKSAQDFADEFSINRIYGDHGDLLANETPAGIVVAAPPGAHMEIVLDCLAAGVKFILCEKPLTLNAEEALALQRAAVAAGATVIEGFMYRYHPQIAKLQELLASGNLGEIDQLHCSVNMFDASEAGASLPENWRRDADLGGGILHDFLCYPIDISNLLVPAMPVRALARGFASPSYGTVYRLFGLIEYENGAVASVSASRLTDFSQPLFVGCSDGSIRVETAFNPIGDTEIVVQRSEGLIGQRHERVQVSTPDPISERLIDLHVFTWQLQHFADLIEGRATACMTLDESLVDARTRDALIQSARTNRWCDL